MYSEYSFRWLLFSYEMRKNDTNDSVCLHKICVFFDTPSPQVLDDFRNVSWNILKGKSVLFKNVCKSENTL